MITGRADIAVYDREGQLVLIVETKSRFDATERWASATFRHAYVHRGMPDVPFFLLALPDSFYLWKDPGRKITADNALVHQEVTPDIIVPAGEIIRPYLGGEDLTVHDISGYAMNMILNAWVADIISSDLSREEAPKHLHWLFDTGLYEAIRGGSMRAEAPVWSS